MKNLPKIKIKKDIKNEVDLFIKFLHHPYYPQHKNLIFQIFPNLKLLIKKSKDERKTVKKFVANFYNNHQNKINKIIKKSDTLVKKRWSLVIKELANLMDYQWSKSVIYYAIPTILPFSPFGTNKFYFSILGQIYNKNKKDILFIAAHEASHFIFYDLLKKIEREIKISLPEDSKNYLKEALTAVLLNQKPLNKILKLNNYLGNPEIRDLKIQKPDNMIMNFVNFLTEYYQNYKIKKGEDFKIVLEEIIKIIYPISNEFSKKRAIWNRYGSQLYKKHSALHLYQNPIKIKK